MRISSGRVKVVAAIILIIAATLFLNFCKPGYYLTVKDRDTGELYAHYPMREGDRFSIEFKHSVNLSPVIDIYEIQGGDIYVEETVYYHFGAGVQTQLNEGETLSYGEDGSMIVSNIHQNRNDVQYIVGTLYDHILTVNGQQVNLRQLCGKNTKIRLNYEFQWF